MVLIRCHDHHGLRRGFRQEQVEGNALLLCEVFHMPVQVPLYPVVVKGHRVTFAGHAEIALFAGNRQFPPVKEGNGHLRCGDLHVPLKIQQRDTVHGHIAVVVDRQRQREPVIYNGIIVPFFQAQPARGNPAPVVGPDQFRSISRFQQVPLFIMQGAGGGDSTLHRILLQSYRTLMAVIVNRFPSPTTLISMVCSAASRSSSTSTTSLWPHLPGPPVSRVFSFPSTRTSAVP